MNKLIYICFLLLSFNSFGMSYVKGVIYVQTRYDQSISDMFKFRGGVELICGGAPTTQSNSEGNFTLSFSDVPSGRPVYLNIPVDKIKFQGVNYEIVNIEALRTHTVSNPSYSNVEIIICKKGMRRKFQQQLADKYFKDQLNKGISDPNKGLLIHNLTSSLLSDKNNQLNREHEQLIDVLNEGDYSSAKRLLQDIAEDAFEYVELANQTNLKHILLYEESIKAIRSYLFACMLTFDNSEGLEAAKRLYEIDDTDVLGIVTYANFLRYVEKYEMAKSLYLKALRSPTDLVERGQISRELGSYYEMLDYKDSAAYYYLNYAKELENLNNSDPDTYDEIMNLYFMTALVFEFDTCVHYYHKAINTGHKTLATLGKNRTDKTSFVDSSTIYNKLSVCFEHMRPLYPNYNDSMVHYRNLSSIDEVYAQLHQSEDDSIEALEKDKLKSDSVGNSYERAKVLAKIAQVHAYQGKFELAKEEINEAIDIFTTLESNELTFRKLRINKADAIKSRGIILNRAGSGGVNVVIEAYFEAMEVYQVSSPLLRRACNKEIAISAKEIFEWLRFDRTSHNGLMIRDSAIAILGAELDKLIQEVEKCYTINPGKYREITAATYLYAAEVFCSSNENLQKARYCAERAFEICERYGWMDTDGIISAKGVKYLKKDLFYSSVVLQLCANAHWILRELDKASESYFSAAELNQQEVEQLQQTGTPNYIYFLPRAQIAYEMFDINSALSYAEWGVRQSSSSSMDELMKAHFLFLAATANMIKRKPSFAQQRLDSLLSRIPSNYAHASSIPSLQFLINIEKRNYKDAMDQVNGLASNDAIYEQCLALLESCLLHYKFNKIDKAKSLFNAIDGERFNELDTLSRIRYLAFQETVTNVKSNVLQDYVGKPYLEFYYISTKCDLYNSNFELNNKRLKKDLKKANKLVESVPYDDLIGGYYETYAEYWALRGKTKKQKAFLDKAMAAYLRVNNEFHANRIKRLIYQ